MSTFLNYTHIKQHRIFAWIALSLLIVGAILALNFNKIGQVYGVDNPAVVGQWSSVMQWPVKSVHTSLLPGGDVIMWPSQQGDNPSQQGDNPYIWNPQTNSIIAGTKPGYNLFCSGFTTLADGKLFVAGGHVTTLVGLNAASIYDPSKKTWTKLPDMNNARWYPTTTSLPNGDVLVTSGTIKQGVVNKIPQVWNIKTNTWRTLSAASLSTPLYPLMFPAPNGKVFMAGTHQKSRYLNTNGAGSWDAPINSKFGRRTSGNAVMYGEGKILLLGGTSANDKPATNSAETINLTVSNPKWTYTNSMAFPRKHANATLLPTGEVLVTGGTYGIGDDEKSPLLLAESWNPNNGVWTKLASNSVYRGYHSTALLLPDGRVLVAGGEKSGQSAEIYSPPYLFKGARPTISSAPNQVNYGQKFLVKTPDVASIQTIRWIRLGSVTHSFNEGQIINSLGFTVEPEGIEITVPGSRNAPPGYYMLFIINNKNVPSVAKIIKVGNI